MGISRSQAADFCLSLWKRPSLVFFLLPLKIYTGDLWGRVCGRRGNKEKSRDEPVTFQTRDFLWMLPKIQLCCRLDICRDFIGLGIMAPIGPKGTETPGKAPLDTIPTFCPLFPPKAPGFVPCPPFPPSPKLPGVIPKWICASKLSSLPYFPPIVDSGAPRWGISEKLWKGFNPHSL